MRISLGSRPCERGSFGLRLEHRLIYEFAHGYYQNHRLSDDIYERMRTLGRQGRRGSCRAHRLLFVRLGDA
jgi:hypothetical protein